MLDAASNRSASMRSHFMLASLSANRDQSRPAEQYSSQQARSAESSTAAGTATDSSRVWSDRASEPSGQWPGRAVVLVRVTGHIRPGLANIKLRMEATISEP